MTHTLKNARVSRDEKAWEIDISAEIPAESLEKYREQTLKEFQKTAKLDGFRQGHAPTERILQVYGESTVLKHAVEHAIQHELPELLASEKTLIVESPRVTIESVEKGKPVKFTARAALPPSVELPDYKAIAKKKNAAKEEITVSDDEHKEAMTHLRRERARIDRMEAGIEPQKAQEESRALKEEELPELDEAFVQSLGMESVEKFSEGLRANIKNEKELRAREKRRAEILEELTKRSTIKYPAILREYELDDMEARLKADLERMGGTFEAYLAQVKKTREQLREEWKETGDKRAQVRLILSEIARKENIEADQDALEREVKHAREHVPNADPQALRAHISHALKNEATLKFLEEQE